MNLSRYDLRAVVDPQARTAKFIRGLQPRLREALASMLLRDFATATRNSETEIARNQGRYREPKNRDGG